MPLKPNNFQVTAFTPDSSGPQGIPFNSLKQAESCQQILAVL